jgi:hypothetical protein
MNVLARVICKIILDTLYKAGHIRICLSSNKSWTLWLQISQNTLNRVARSNHQLVMRNLQMQMQMQMLNRNFSTRALFQKRRSIRPMCEYSGYSAAYRALEHQCLDPPRLRRPWADRTMPPRLWTCLRPVHTYMCNVFGGRLSIIVCDYQDARDDHAKSAFQKRPFGAHSVTSRARRGRRLCLMFALQKKW